MTQRRDPEDADTHYRDGRHYDHAYSHYKSDVAFYVMLADAVASGGAVLELGVGTGRVAMAIADRGIELVGVDRMPSMLEQARQRLAKRPRRLRDNITLIEADFRDVRLDRRFDLIISPFNAFQHLYTRADVEQTLATCRHHLADDGRLAFDVLMPDPYSLARDPDRFYRCRPIKHSPESRRFLYEEAFRYDQDTQIQTTVMRFTDPDDESVRFYDYLPQRQFFPEELRALLHYNGFELLSMEGGFEGEPVDERAESLVVVAR